MPFRIDHGNQTLVDDHLATLERRERRNRESWDGRGDTAAPPVGRVSMRSEISILLRIEDDILTSPR